MIEVVRDKQLFESVRRFSAGSKRVWIASPYLGRGAHNIFDPSFMTSTDNRLLLDIKSGYVDKVELRALKTWTPNGVRTLRRLHAKLYIFDSGAIIASANLSKNAFELNREIGVVFTGADLSIAREAYTALFKEGKVVTNKQIALLRDRKITGGPLSRSSDKVPPHTVIDDWDESESRTPSSDEENIFDEVAPTFEAEASFGEVTINRIKKRLSQMRLQRVQYFSDGYAVKAARKKYRSGAMFDVSVSREGKKENWKQGAVRHLGIVKCVFAVPGYAIVAYRTEIKYDVDSALLAAAKRLHVYSGKPNFSELIEYQRIVMKRKQKIHSAQGTLLA